MDPVLIKISETKFNQTTYIFSMDHIKVDIGGYKKNKYGKENVGKCTRNFCDIS